MSRDRLLSCLLILVPLIVNFYSGGVTASLVAEPVYGPCPTGQQCCLGLCCDKSAICMDTGCYTVLYSSVIGTPTSFASAICQPMVLSITADDGLLELYIDGVDLLTGLPPPPNNWQYANVFNIPAGSKLIAVKSRDIYGTAGGLLASVNNDYFVTDKSWFCRADFIANWMMPPVADVYWPQAVETDTNPGFPHTTAVAGISPQAKWIWTAKYASPNIDSPVYCRGFLPHLGCTRNYTNCTTDLCRLQQSRTCCDCDLLSKGPTKLCSCCPKGYFCCGPVASGQSYFCCPYGTTCEMRSQSCTKANYYPAPTFGQCSITPA